MSKQRLMTRWASACRATAALAAIALGWALPVQAQVSISSGGTPSFSQGIEVPPGVAGMAPKLGILYAGGGVNGPLGHGWSVQGISTITRCAPTIATDNQRGSVKYDAQDKLCLDGQRLIQVTAPGNASATAAPTQTNDSAGTPVGSPREYRTEKDSYTRIRAYGDINGAPAYFLVWNKSGQVYEYGKGPSDTPQTNALITTQKTVSGVTTTVTMAWAVARIRDTLGNAIDFKYEQRYVSWGSGVDAANPGVATQGKEWNLLEVQYARNKVIFNYDPTDSRQDKSEAYHQGYKNVSARLLQSIVTYSGTTSTALGPQGTAVKTVKLEYDEGVVTKRKRLTALQVCAGDASSTRCTPKTTFAYSAGGTQAYTASSNFGNGGSNLPTTQLISGSANNLGIVVGDFNGDGRTDFIRWADDPTQNQLFLSNGDGSFTASSNFNLKQAGQNLFHSNACYYSLIADLNADGLPDIFRFTSSKGSCAPTVQPGLSPTTLFVNQGDGSFLQRTYIGPSLDRTRRQKVRREGIDEWTYGATFYLLDVNADGRPDIVTAEYPDADGTSDVLCAGIACNRVFLGDGVGGFVETVPSTPVAVGSLYSTPVVNSFVPKTLVDVNGDGYTDITGVSGNSAGSIFISNGDGTFTAVKPAAGLTADYACSVPMDFNGDGRKDCFVPAPNSGASSKIMVSDGSGTMSAVTGLIAGPSAELVSATGSVVIADFNGDGRDDILRWNFDAASNGMLLSKGDGTFEWATNFNLTGPGDVLKSADQLTDFVFGDFTGQGNTEILRLKTGPTGNDNQNVLYVKTVATPPDQLVSVTSGTGLRTDLSYVALSSTTASGRYTSDRGDIVNAAIYPTVDLTLPMQVVTTMTAQTGVGSGVATTEYAYAGLKADIKGRGILGFREVRRQSPGPNGDPLTVRTTYLQQHPYIGVASRTETRNATFNNLGAPLLSRTVNLYCDTSVSGVTPTEAAPCAVSAKIQRPYLFQVTEEGWDLGGIALPKVVTTNLFNTAGDPTRITVATSGTSAGILQTSTKVVDNLYQADQTSGDDWILGRLTKATATNTVQDLRASLVPGFGTAANANAVVGTGGSGGTTPTIPTLVLTGCVNSGSTMTPTKATYTCTLGNTGSASATTVTYPTKPAGTTVTAGPTSCAALTANCGPVVVSSPTTVGTYSGTVVARPNTGTSATSASFTLTVVAATPANLTLTNCVNSGPSTSPTTATYSCVLGNSGGTNATTITYTRPTGTTITGGVTSCSANNAACSTVVISSPTTAGTYSGTLTATPATGTAATSAPFTLTVNPASPLTLSACTNSGATTSPTQATYTCRVGNTATTPVSISYNSAAGAVVGPLTCTANNTNCGNAIVRSSTNAGSYVGTLVATPGTGPARTSASFTLAVNKAASITSMVYAPASPEANKPITYTASVSGATPGGTVNFYVGGSFIGSATIASGQAVFTQTAGIAAGSYTAYAAYAGDANNTSSTSSNAAITVIDKPTFTISRNPNPMVAGQSFVVTWSTTGATSLSYSCTAAGTGFTGTQSVPVSGTSTETALAGWVGYPSSCAWTATGPTGTTVVNETLNTVKTNTSTAFSINPTNPVAGAPITVSATVSGFNPTGTVTWYCSAVVCGAGPTPLVNGVATYTNPIGTGVGTVPMYAVYNGDANNSTSTSNTVNIVVTVKATPTVALTSSANPAAVGSAVTFTANVSGYVPTGSVQFMDNGVVMGAPVTLASGVATYTTSALTNGPHSITASYSGDANNNTRVSAAVPQSMTVIDKPIFTISRNPNPMVAGQSFVVTWSTTDATSLSYSCTAAGTGFTGTQSVPVSGTSTSMAQAAWVGYPSNCVWTATGAGGTTVVNETLNTVKANTSTAFSINPTNPVAGAPITVTAVVSGNSPTGTVTWYCNGSSCGSTALVNGVATFVNSAGTGVGTVAMYAVYNGDANNNASTSNASNIVVTVKANTSTALSINPTNPVAATPITYTASIAGYAPSGTVNFYVGGSLIGSAAIASGQAVFTQSAGLAAGSYSASATYVGDANNNTSTSSATAVTVAAPVNATVTVSPTSFSYGSVRAGSAKSTTFTVSNTSAVAANGLTLTATTSNIIRGDYAVDATTCGSSLAAGASCTATVTFYPDCGYGSVSGSFRATGGNFTMASSTLSGTSTTAPGNCN